MSKQAKMSLKLPIFLIIGPALGLILSIILYAVINFLIVSSASPAPDASINPSLSDGASVTQGVNNDTELYGDSSIFRTISNVLLFLLGSASLLAFVPCLVFGIIILNKRRNAQMDVESVARSKGSRDWRDLE
jgi:ABC-type sugar transport system permease subunit